MRGLHFFLLIPHSSSPALLWQGERKKGRKEERKKGRKEERKKGRKEERKKEIKE
jgi:hypothetical protein